MSAVLLSVATFFSTGLGGLFALRHRDRLHLIMGFTAGVLLGLVAFDLLPEIFARARELSLDSTAPMLGLVVGFLAFHIAEKLTIIHHAHEADYATHHHPRVGVLSALALSGHSFLDGVGIGVGFKVSAAVGIVVAVAVIAHDFSDGLNTVTLMLVNKNTSRRALGMLLVDALAPVLGAFSTLFFTIPDAGLPIYLGFFAGFLLYIGASDILPEAHRQRSSAVTVALTVLGATFAFVVTRFLNG
ncbi:MAG TPA: ZIP family metal transporter [Ktedonobacterales bacterium]|nr:ZIP family metal transporter [Ktedonobacterales bacterium]